MMVQRRKRRNQRKILKEERGWLKSLVTYRHPHHQGQVSKKAYIAIRAFEIEQMTYDFFAVTYARKGASKLVL